MESLNEKIDQALEGYVSWIENEQNFRKHRYSDDKFKTSAMRKAEVTYSKLPGKVQTDRTLFMSVGGADGTELFQLLKLSKSRHGILLEYDDRSTDAAKDEAKRRNLEIRFFTGDLMQKIDEAMNSAITRVKQREVDHIVVSAHAVLHELFTRSIPQFKLRKYFSKLSKATVIIGREPIDPPLWPDYIHLSGDFDVNKLKKLADIIRQYHAAKSGRQYREPEIINPKRLELHRGLAIETMTKAFYSEDFLYELEECVTSISLRDIQREIAICLVDHTCGYELMTSISFEQQWEHYGLQTFDANEEQDLWKPLSHMWYRAVRKVPETTAARIVPVQLAPDEDVGDPLSEILNAYRSVYSAGKIITAREKIEAASRLAPHNTSVIRKYITVLLRFSHDSRAKELLEAAANLEDDNIRLAAGEYYWRRGELDEALEVLQKVTDRTAYNAEYQLGICYLLLYGKNRSLQHLALAKSHLEKAHALQPTHWWVTLNLAITYRCMGLPNEELEGEAQDQIEAAIGRYPLKASVRLYRLLSLIAKNNYDEFISIIKSDKEKCSKEMQIGADFFATVQDRVKLLINSVDECNKYFTAIMDWANSFTVLC